MKPFCALALLFFPLSPGPTQDDEEKIKARQAEIAQFLKTAKEDRQFRAALGDLRRLADRAYEINRYEISARLHEQAEKVARILKDAALATELQGATKRARETGKEYEKVVRSELKLSALEGKPEDYLVTAKFYALVKGDWKAAIPLLAKGSDAKLKEAAEADLGEPKSPDEQVALAERWWALGEKYRERALHWYGTAWLLSTGVAKERLRTRCLEVSRHRVTSRPPLEVPAKWTRENSGKTVQLDAGCAHAGTCSVRFDPSSGKPGDEFSGLKSGAIPSAEGRAYVLSGWVLSDGNVRDDNLMVVAFDAGGKTITLLLAPVPIDSPFWTRISREVTCPPTTTSIDVRLQMLSRSGRIWLDEVSLRDENEAELLQNGSFEEMK